MAPTDRDVTERFERRYAAIDTEIPPTPPFPAAGSPRPTASAKRNLAVLAAAIVVLVVAVPLFGVPWSALSPQASGQGSPGASADASGPPFGLATPDPNLHFPSTVSGLPVIKPSEAAELLAAGKLDGRAVAVAGYYDAFNPPCPYPGRYIGPLEHWCSTTTLADTPEDARLCEVSNNGTSCHGPSGEALQPFFMPETSGALAQIFQGQDTADPLAMVLIGHGGDPRQWRCTEETREECAHAFVVDKVAWALGAELPVTMPDLVDPGSNTSLPLTPSMRVDQVIAAIGPGRSTVITAAAFRAIDIAFIDPRWTLPGDELTWFVRSISDAESTSGGSARVDVWLVHDETGQVFAIQPVAVDAGFGPARVWQVAVVHGVECCTGDLSPYLRVVSPSGDTVFLGQLSGGASGEEGMTTFGGGYGSIPLVLVGGEYTFTVWLGTYPSGVIGPHLQECSGTVTLRPLDKVTVTADFMAGKPCTIASGPGPTTAP